MTDPAGRPPIYNVFISHGLPEDAVPGQDTLEQFVASLKEARDKVGDVGRRIEFVYDQDTIRRGDQWLDVIYSLIDHARAALILVTKRSVGRAWVHAEAAILSYLASNEQLLVIPVELEAGALDEIRRSGREYARGRGWRVGEWHIDPAFLQNGPARLLNGKPVDWRGDLNDVAERTIQRLIQPVASWSADDPDWNFAVDELTTTLLQRFADDSLGRDKLRDIVSTYVPGAGSGRVRLARALILEYLLKNPDKIWNEPRTSYLPGVPVDFSQISIILNEANSSDERPWAPDRLKEITRFWPDPRAAAMLRSDQPGEPAPAPPDGPTVRFRAISFTGQDYDDGKKVPPPDYFGECNVLRWHVQRAHIKATVEPKIISIPEAEFELGSYGASLGEVPAANTAYFHVTLQTWNASLVTVLHRIKSHDWGIGPGKRRTFVLSAVGEDPGDPPEDLPEVVWVRPELSVAEEARMKEAFAGAMRDVGGWRADPPGSGSTGAGPAGSGPRSPGPRTDGGDRRRRSARRPNSPSRSRP